MKVFKITFIGVAGEKARVGPIKNHVIK